MQFLNIKRYSKSAITFTFAELKKLEETEHSCVEKETRRLHLTLLPFHLSNISSSISEILSSNVTKYNKDLDGILLGYKNVKILDSTPAIHNDNCLVHVTVDAEFYLFKPCEGKTLVGLVNQISDDHIGCLVHKAFNVVVPKEQNGNLVRKNQHILVQVSYTNLEAKLPYIKADLISIISDTDSGISTSEENHFDTSISENIPEVFIKKNKSPKNAKHEVYKEESETTSGMHLINVTTIAESTLKQKKNKKQKRDQHPEEDRDNYENLSKKKKTIAEDDDSCRMLDSYLNDHLQEKNNLELPLQKKKKKKKSKSSECENREEFLPNTLNEKDNYSNNDDTNITFSIKKSKKKRSKEYKEENQDMINEDPELLAFAPEKKYKKHKKKKFLNEDDDNHSSKSLEVSEKNSFLFDKEDDPETEEMLSKQHIVEDKSPKFKILQNIIINRPDQELKLKEYHLANSSKNKHSNIAKDIDVSSEDTRNPKKKKKHKNDKKDDLECYNLDVIDNGDLKQVLLNHDSNKNDFIENKHKPKNNSLDKYFNKSNENMLNLIEDLRPKSHEGALDDTEYLDNIRKPKKSKKHNSSMLIATTLGDLDKSEDNTSFDLIEELKNTKIETLKSTLEDATCSKKNKKPKKTKKDNIDQDLNELKDDTFNIIEDLKQRLCEKALGASKDSLKSKKHKKSKQDLMHDSQSPVENVKILDKKSKHKESKDTGSENSITSNDSTIHLIEDLKRRVIENTLEINKKSKHKKLQKLDESTIIQIEDMKSKAIENVLKESSSKEDNSVETVNINVESKNKKVKKAKKHDKNTELKFNLNEPEIDDIKHTALAQALSKISGPSEIKTQKKKKKKHREDLDINELKSQTLQKILGNLNDDEISSRSKKKKKKKEKNDIDIDEIKQMAMNKLLHKDINKEGNDSSGEETEQLRQHRKNTKEKEKSLQNLILEHRFGDDESKHKVKKKKKEKN